LPRRERHVAWIWPALLLAGLISMAALRVWSGWATRPMVASGDGTEGFIEGDGANLAPAARRLRQLQTEMDQTRRRLADLLAEAADKRQQVQTLDEMLTTGRLTDTPDFLRGRTTVRALQKIIREAGGSAFAGSDQESRLTTAALVARERLRAKLTALADELKQDLAECEQRAATLRPQLHFQRASVRRLRGRIQERLDSPAAPPSVDAAPDG